MATAKLPMKKWILLLVTAGLLALLLFMYFIVGFGNVISQIEKTNLYYYAAAFLAVLASITFFSLTWRSLLANLSVKIKLRQAFLFVCAGMFIDSLVPEPANITGDLVKAYLVSKVTGESSGKTTASVIGQKTLGMAHHSMQSGCRVNSFGLQLLPSKRNTCLHNRCSSYAGLFSRSNMLRVH